MQKATAIIVNWNTGKLLAECLESLRNLPEQGNLSRVILVDNNSNDNSLVEAESLVGEWPKLTIIKKTTNAGFAAANNEAAKFIKELGDNDSHIWLLNPDTIVKPGALAAMIRVLETKPKAGVVGPHLFNADGSEQLSVRQFPSGMIMAGMLLKLPHFWKKWPRWQSYLMSGFDYSQAQIVDQVMGAAFLVRRQVWEKLNGLDEGFWIWFEEVDFCRRVQDAGWEVWYSPVGEIIHYGGASFHQLVGFRKSWPWIKSSLRYTYKHLGRAQWLMILMLLPAAIGIAGAAAKSHFRDKNKNQSNL